jgi:four helix bundle protein
MTKPKRHNYENLEIYKRSLANAVKVMELIDNIRPFKLADQISGAAISVPSNIAEGSERTTSKEFRRFLEYSSGSESELATQLTVLKLANRLPGIALDEMIKETKEINSMIRGFMNTLGD